MTVGSIRRLSKALARDMVRGERSPALDKRLAHLFAGHFDRFDRAWSARRFTLWLDRECYLELRRQLLLSGHGSLTSFLIKRLGLRTGPAPKAKGN